jgi:hypothetical protein
MLEKAQPAKDPAAPAAELTKVVGTGPLPNANSPLLAAAVSGCFSNINEASVCVVAEETNHVGRIFMYLLGEHIQSLESLITDEPWNRVRKWKGKIANDKHTFLHRRD